MILPDRENMTLEFKARYEYNFFNYNQSIRFRPTFTYFWMPEGEPVASFFMQAEQVLGLNYGTHSINERWLYLGGLYHFNSVDLLHTNDKPGAALLNTQPSPEKPIR